MRIPTTLLMSLLAACGPGDDDDGAGDGGTTVANPTTADTIDATSASECGGSDRGTCAAQDGLPTCTCLEGYENETYALYCCPLRGDDPYCPA